MGANKDGFASETWRRVKTLTLTIHGNIGDMARPAKGERDAILAKPPIAFGRILKQKATEEGLPYGEYLVALAARALDMPQYAPSNDHANQLDIPEEAPRKAA